MQANPLTNLLAAVHDAYLQQREARTANHLHACRARQTTQRRPRQARRPQTAPAPIAAPPAPTFAPAALPAYPRIPKTGYRALIGLLEAIDTAAADASQDGERMVEFKIGRTTYHVRQTFKNLAKLKAQVIRYRTAFSDKSLA